MFIEGFQLSKEQRKQNLPQFIKDDLKRQIRAGFNIFDENGDGTIEAKEMQKAMKTVGSNISQA